MGRGAGGGRGRAASAVLALALAAVALCRWWRSATPAEGSALVRLERHFPSRSPRTLAHLLADFRTQRDMHPHMQHGLWRVEAETGNITWWRYDVRYGCGAEETAAAGRCAGEVRLEAHELRGAGAGTGGQHRLLLSDRYCPPRNSVCEWWESSAQVEEGEAAGATYREETRGSCGRGGGWGAGCAERLRGRREDALTRLHYILLQQQGNLS